MAHVTEANNTHDPYLRIELESVIGCSHSDGTALTKDREDYSAY
jgi:hypothetical protein